MQISMQHRLIDKAGVGAAVAASLLVLGFTTPLVFAQTTAPHSAVQVTSDAAATNAQLQAQVQELRVQVAQLQKAQKGDAESGTDAVAPMPAKEQDAAAMGKHMQMMAKHMQDMGKRMESKGKQMEKKGMQMEQKKCCSAGTDKAKAAMDMDKMDMGMSSIGMAMDKMDKDTMSKSTSDKPMTDKPMESEDEM